MAREVLIQIPEDSNQPAPLEFTLMSDQGEIFYTFRAAVLSRLSGMPQSFIKDLSLPETNDPTPVVQLIDEVAKELEARYPEGPKNEAVLALTKNMREKVREFYGIEEEE